MARRPRLRAAARFDLGIEQAASSALQLADASIVRAIQLSRPSAARSARYALVRSAARPHAARIAEARHLDHRRAPSAGDLSLRAGGVRLHQVRAVTRKMKLDDGGGGAGRCSARWARLARSSPI
jgi:N-methylhydantoinase A